ncbi:glycosyltransferase family 2 protein [Burkholderia sp. FL-7-2-10-S1-D7]|uniref:glycosyltransferase family 2 protein n=1 Tax=Burkholderia sp. FL-7-2-10-S1-D7 TaxID=1637866 RepID=UPI00211D2B5E|nr:glycosyltransferase family 2 protein [Burkholderia sp. FL-7-2-10-S1-D7]
MMIGIVIVFYRPDAGCVARANRLARYGRCVVVDNSERLQLPSALGLDGGVHYIANGNNLGIAKALNQGVDFVRANGCDCALLFDQDSQPAEHLFVELPAALMRELEAGRRVAVVGPAYEDVRLGGVAPFVRFSFPRLERVPAVGDRLLPVDFLITSGSCINLRAWDDVGPMDESLFIDFVDVEWCVRARRAGFEVLGAPNLRLAHELGGEPVNVFGRNYPSHSAIRHYYLFRNAVALSKRGYMPWSWKANELLKMPARLVIYGLWLKPRREHVRMALRGVWHGLIGRMGALCSS